MSERDGGAAFPKPETERYMGTDGMSLLDFFAAHALQGMLSYSEGGESPDVYDPGWRDDELEPLHPNVKLDRSLKKNAQGYWVWDRSRTCDGTHVPKASATYEARIARNAYEYARAMLAAREAE